MEPVRRALNKHFDIDEDAKGKSKTVITYIEHQEPGALRLGDADHIALVTALKKLGREYGYEINVVSEANWNDRMFAVAKSTVRKLRMLSRWITLN